MTRKDELGDTANRRHHARCTVNHAIRTANESADLSSNSGASATLRAQASEEAL
ncbi:hypothetical protein O9929_27705 [Vibrio lentus]|nr:hypothetical protein [Vibrio lentus]